MTITIKQTADKLDGALAWADDHAPTYAEGVATLYSWSSNYEDFKPFRKFLDLIGYPETAYGDDTVTLADWSRPTDGLGYMEIGYLADALQEYANRPEDVERFIMELLEVESEVGL
jgi:hypothetical protein